jgi:hypothetical protein
MAEQGIRTQVKPESRSNNATRASGPRSLTEHARRIRQDSSTLASDVTALASEVRGTTSSVMERTVLDQMRNQPLRTLGMAAGVGYLLGGGIPLRLTGLLFGTATRVAAGLALLREIAELSQQLQSSVQRMNASGTQARP